MSVLSLFAFNGLCKSPADFGAALRALADEIEATDGPQMIALVFERADGSVDTTSIGREGKTNAHVLGVLNLAAYNWMGG